MYTHPHVPHISAYGLFTLSHYDMDSDPDLRPKMGTVTIRDPDLDWNPSHGLCNENSICVVQWGLESESESVSESVFGNVNKPLV